MAYNIVATGSYCQFQNKIVIRVWQGRAPKEEDVLQVSHREQEIEETLGLRPRALQEVLRPQQDGPVFDEEWHRDYWLKPLIRQAREQSVRRSSPRACGCNQHTGVKDHSHCSFITFGTLQSRSAAMLVKRFGWSN